MELERVDGNPRHLRVIEDADPEAWAPLLPAETVPAPIIPAAASAPRTIVETTGTHEDRARAFTIRTFGLSFAGAVCAVVMYVGLGAPIDLWLILPFFGIWAGMWFLAFAIDVRNSPEAVERLDVKETHRERMALLQSQIDDARLYRLYALGLLETEGGQKWLKRLLG